MASTHQNTHHSNSVKDPEHDGRLKENRESGPTKGTTPGSEARAREHGREPSQGSHSRHESSSRGGESHRSSSSQHDSGRSHASGGSDDLKSREYRDENGEVHHHTRTYMEQHGSSRGDR